MTVAYLHCGGQEVEPLCGTTPAQVDGRVEMVEVVVKFFRVFLPVVGGGGDDVIDKRT